MSRNSKNARRMAEAREHSKRRQSGSNGPKINTSAQKSKTHPGKKTYRTDEYGNPREDRRKSMGEFEASISERITKRWKTTGVSAPQH